MFYAAIDFRRRSLMSADIPCALCGSNTADRVMGRIGCACSNCLGEAAKQVIAKQNQPMPPAVTASDLCLMCGDPITKGGLVAVRGPYKICHSCLVSAVQEALPLGTTDFVQVNF
jgi:hypothetical protein